MADLTRAARASLRVRRARSAQERADAKRVLAEGEPSQRIANVDGKIWRRVIGKGELPQLQNDHAVISTRLAAGKTVVHVFSEERPAGFEAVQPSLADVYFSTLHGAEAA